MPEEDASRRSLRATTWPPIIAFGIAFVAATALALRGGTYDIVARQEAAILVWWALALGWGLGVLPRSRPHQAVLLPIGALVALGAWTFLSLGWTGSDERTLAEGCRIIGYLGLLLLVLSVLDRRTWRPAAAGLGAAALFVAALAAASRLAPDLFPTDPVRLLAGGRLSYPFNYWNAVGAWGAMAVTAALAWSVSSIRPAARAAFLAAAPAAALSIYLAYSRAAIAGIVVGLLCVLALSRRRLQAALHLLIGGAAAAAAVLVAREQTSLARGIDDTGAGTVFLVLVAAAGVCAAGAIISSRVGADRWRMPRGPARAAGAMAAGCVLVVAVVAGPGLASRGWDEFKESGVQPTPPRTAAADPARRLGSLQGSRYSVWSAALDTYRADPARGTGAGTFEFAWNRSGRSSEFIRDAHSIYLEPAAELGLPGALLMVLFLLALAGVTLQALGRARRTPAQGPGVALAAVLAVFLVQAGLDWMWESTAVAVLALGGCAVLWTRLSRQGARLRPGLAPRLAVSVLCLCMCLVLVPGVVSSSLVRESQRSLKAADLPGAAAQADDAIASAPWAATPRLQRGLVAERQGDLRGARSDFKDAAAREPENWRIPLLLARVEAELGRPAAALRQYRRARRLRPEADVFKVPGA